MFAIPLQIRPSDHDSLGHVNNAAYVAYLQHAVAEFVARNGFAADWREDGPYRWHMEEVAIEYRLASAFGDEIVAHVWLAETGQLRPVFGCEIRRAQQNGASVIMRTRSRWQRQASATGEATELPQNFPEPAGQEAGDLPRPFKAPVETEQVRSYQWRHTVERSEVGPGARTHPHVLFEWIEEGILRASAEGGWPIERCLAENFVVFQMRHDASIFLPAVLGETVEISSRLVKARRLGGTWQNQIRSLADGRLLASNYSTGVFLNLDGRPTSAPPGMIEALQALSPAPAD